MKTTIGIILTIIVLAAAYRVYDQLSYDFNRYKGTLHEEVVSPDGAYTAKAYYHYYGGAVGGVNAFVNVVFHEDGDVEKTIYFSDAKSNFEIQWLDEKRLSITNIGGGVRNAVLTVGEEVYDENGRACRKWRVSSKYTCFSKDVARS